MKSYIIRCTSALVFLGVVFVAEDVYAARLFFVSPQETVFTGDIVRVSLYADTEGEAINAGDVTVTYTGDTLEALSVERGGSFFTLWTEEPYADTGTVRFSGGTPIGFTGDSGLIGTVTFRAAKAGEAEISTNPSSLLVKHDGYGTPAALNVERVQFSVAEIPEGFIELSSRTHPEENRWYHSDTFVVSWEAEEEALYSYLITQDPFAVADEMADEPVGDVKFSGLSDGVWYFTIRKRGEGDASFSAPVRYLVQNDRTPPESFDAVVARDKEAFGGSYFVSFAATDGQSGVNYYEVKEGSMEPEKAVSPYVLKDQMLSQEITITAVDFAGNVRRVDIRPEKKAPVKKIPFAGITALVLLIAALLAAAHLVKPKRGRGES
jgi:hypothetical protein